MTELTPIEDKRSDEGLGSYLARAREARGMSVERLATETKLSVKNITFIEKGDWKSFPVEAYLRGYLNSICSKLNIDFKRVLAWYSAESGYKHIDLLDEKCSKSKVVKPLDENETKPKSKAVPIVIVFLGLSFVVGSHFLQGLGGDDANVEPQKTVVVADSVNADQPEMPEGAEAVPADTVKPVVQVDSSQKKVSVTQAQVEEAIKKSERPASATIFISSASEKKDVPAAPVAGEKGKATRLELVGSGEARTWVGLKRHEDDDAFLKETNIATAGNKLIYNADDTLFVVIGEPKAVSKMLLNGVVTSMPVMQYGRVTRFCVYDGKIVNPRQ